MNELILREAHDQKNKKSINISEIILVNEDISFEIVKNIENFINFIKENPLSVSKKRLFITPQDLISLNFILLKPIKIDIQRPQPSSFPHINAIFWLLRTIKLVKVIHIKNNLFMQIDTSVLNEWLSLNLTERYFTLLDAWLFWAKSIIIDETRYDNFILFKYIKFWSRLTQSTKISDTENYKYSLGNYNLALFEMFGFLKIKHEEPNVGKGWNYSFFEKTELGSTIFSILYDEIKSDSSNIYDLIGKDKEKFKSFSKSKKYFQKYIPEWKNNLNYKNRKFISGIYIFSVFLGKKKKLFSFDAKDVLEIFSNKIISEFNLDGDHLFEFICKDNSSGLITRIGHDYMEQLPYTVSEFKIGNLPLECGDEMIFHYDFGDDIRLQIILDKIN